MASRVQSMIRKSLDSFVKSADAELARNVLVSDDAVDELRDAVSRGTDQPTWSTTPRRFDRAST